MSLDVSIFHIKNTGVPGFLEEVYAIGLDGLKMQFTILNDGKLYSSKMVWGQIFLKLINKSKYS